jgi:hypothetical protein
MRRIFSRKGATAQRAAAFLRGFLCAFAPLREKNLFYGTDERDLKNRKRFGWTDDEAKADWPVAAGAY